MIMLNMKIYWFVGRKHCEKSRPVLQRDGKIGYTCKHLEA